MSEHELWNELGNLYFMSGAYNQAIQAYRRSIQADDRFGRPYSNLALTYAQQGKFEEAVRLFRRGIELLDDNREKAISWLRLGDVFRRVKEYREAVFAYQAADALDPDAGMDRDRPDQGLYAQADPSALEQPSEGEVPILAIDDRAIRAAAEASQLDEWPSRPLAPEAGEADSATEYLQGDAPIIEPAAAVSWSEDGAPPGSSNAEVFFGAGEVAPGEDAGEGGNFLQNWFDDVPAPDPVDEAGQAGRWEERERLMAPGNRETLSAPGGPQELAEEGGDPGAMIEAEPPTNPEEQYLDRLTPDKSTVYEAESPEADIEARRPSPARQTREDDLEQVEIEIEKLRRVLQLNPRNSIAWDTLGTLYKSINYFAQAVAAYQQAISVDDEKAIYYHHLALALAADGRDEDAVSALEKVIELDPDHSLAHATLGGYYRKLGLEEIAQKHIGIAMKSIFDSENEYNRACMEAIRGHADQAINLLQVALEKKQTYVDWVLRDPDLDFIRQDPRFKRLISDFAR